MDGNDLKSLAAARRRIGISGKAKTIWPPYPHPVSGLKLIIAACAGELEGVPQNPQAAFGSVIWAINEYFPTTVDVGAQMITNAYTIPQKDFAALAYIAGVFSVPLATRSAEARSSFDLQDAPYFGVIYLSARPDVKSMGVALRKAGLI